MIKLGGRRFRTRSDPGRQEAFRRRRRTVPVHCRPICPTRRSARPSWCCCCATSSTSPEATHPGMAQERLLRGHQTPTTTRCWWWAPRTVFDLRHEYQFPPFAAAKVLVLRLHRPPAWPPAARGECRQPAGRGDRDAPLVLVTPGGGEDGFQPHGDTTLRGPGPPVARHDCPRTHIVCGPELDEARRAPRCTRRPLALPNG